MGLVRPVFCRFRWFSGSSSDGYLSSMTLETDKNSEFEDMGIHFFDETAKKEKISEASESNNTPKQVSDIIELIRSCEDDLASKLNSMGLTSLSVQSINEIFRVLNCERISALNFFQWVLVKNPNLYNNYDICSLIIDNCGWLNDYKTMVSMLNEFKEKRICLTEKAFGFLPVLGSSKSLTEESIRRQIKTLNEVGGSCYNSGICALINMLCELDSFEMAKFVIEVTERKVSHYNILIRQMCRRYHVEEAQALMREMRELGCNPNIKTYNYLLGCLCKNGKLSEASRVLEGMQEVGTPPDSLTFEVFIYYLCKLGKLDAADEFLDQMVSRGIEPRYSTHAAFIYGYFNTRQYEEAYKYVNRLGENYKESSNMIYSLLAGLHQKKGDLFVAQSILIEMMDKGLKPHFPVYVRTMKRLAKTGRGHLAWKLKSKFSKFSIESSTRTV